MSFIPKLFTPYKPRLIPQECIKGKVWVHKVDRWGNKRIITRHDATVEPIMNGDRYDAKLAESIGKVKNNSFSNSTKGNSQIQKIVDLKQPINITRYTIFDSVYFGRIIGLIRSGNERWTYRISNDGDIMIHYVNPKEIEALKEAAKNRKK